MSGLNVWKQRDSIVSNVKNSVKIKLGALIHAREWASKGIFAVIDQALFSGSNFIVNILLARWLPPEEYGAFAVALSVFYLLAGFHTAVLTEPMMVFGAGKYREQFCKYLGIVFWGHWGISAIIALCMGVTAWVFSRMGSPTMAYALFGLAVASPFLLLIWLTRRACYAQLHPALAVVGSGFNLLITLAGLFLVWRTGVISSFSGFLLLGAAGGFASFLILRLRPPIVGYVGNPTPSMVLVDHWKYGRWSILGFSFYWASGQILMLLIPIFLGLTASAAVAATWTLYRPVSQFMQALGSLVLPVFSRLVSEPDGQKRLRQRTIRVAALFAGAVALYGLAVSFFAKPILHFLYAGKYDEHWMLVLLFGVVLVFSTVTGVFASALKAVGRVKESAKVWLVSSFVTATLAIPFMKAWGVEGAVTATVVGYFTAFFVSLQSFNHSNMEES